MGADIIQQFVDWMETTGAAQLAGAAVGIMAIAAIFAGIRLGKRLVYSTDDPGEPEDRIRAEGMTDDEIDPADHSWMEARDEGIATGAFPEEGGDLEDPEEVSDQIEQAVADGDLDEARRLCDDNGYDIRDWL